MEASITTVGRLAPSPTGRLHVGHARSFLIAWWSVRAAGGQMLLRMEDLDRSRVRPEFVDGVLRDLEWLGLDWHGPTVSQFEGRQALHEAAQELCDRGLAYPCVCTRREVQEAIAAPHAGETVDVYPGLCRDKYDSIEAARAESGREPALRFRTAPGLVEFTDLLHGPQSSDVAREVGDFPITSRDGQVAYQLAVVVDDARQGVTEVLRGDDLLDSTARQLLLQRALSLPSPRWGHLGLVVDASGRRLAKRADDVSLERLREAGVDPRHLVSWVAAGAGLPSGEARPAAAWIDDFRLPAEPDPTVRFDAPELDSLVSGRVPATSRSSGLEMF
jgi:glutamyl-tRNA synthetase